MVFYTFEFLNTIKNKYKNLHTLININNSGVGGAVITGYKYAISIGADVLVKIDGDGQMDASLIYKFDGPNGVIDIERPSSTYIETTNDGFLAFRIYLKEPSGTVLGANFMNNLNIIFDIERELIGFAVSDCT